jgi:hypothetical protein
VAGRHESKVASLNFAIEVLLFSVWHATLK